mmetsp:Transcript_118581/g.281487  ORF Transcript_118581/g.281487 Transcript_118581/m.281487 type:complete len:267 (-) Transcript_118581:431-1231(-)
MLVTAVILLFVRPPGMPVGQASLAVKRLRDGTTTSVAVAAPFLLCRRPKMLPILIAGFAIKDLGRLRPAVVELVATVVLLGVRPLVFFRSLAGEMFRTTFAFLCTAPLLLRWRPPPLPVLEALVAVKTPAQHRVAAALLMVTAPFLLALGPECLRIMESGRTIERLCHNILRASAMIVLAAPVSPAFRPPKYVGSATLALVRRRVVRAAHAVLKATPILSLLSPGAWLVHRTGRATVSLWASLAHCLAAPRLLVLGPLVLPVRQVS